MQKQASPLKYRDGACFHGSFTCPLLCSTKVNSSGNFVVHSLATSSLCRSSTLRQLVSEQKSLLKLLELLLPVSSAIRLISLFIYAVSTQIPEPFCIEMVPGFSFMWIKLLSQFDIFQDFRLQYLYILLVINNQWYRIDVGKHTGQLCYLCLRHFAEAIHYLNIT